MILSGLFRVYKTFNIFICNLGFRIRGLFWKGLRIDAQPWRPHGKIQMLDLVKNWKKQSKCWWLWRQYFDEKKRNGWHFSWRISKSIYVIVGQNLVSEIRGLNSSKFCGNYKNPNFWPIAFKYTSITLVCNKRYIFAPMSSKLCLCVYSNWFKLRENTWKYVDWELRWNYRDVLVKLRAYSTLFWTASCIIWFIRSKVKPL